MKSFKIFYIFLLFFLPFKAHALVIKDVISVNKILEIDWRSYDFDITRHGYNHHTDTINNVTLTYDFSSMVDEGDDFDDYDTLETIQLNSYIFDGRTNFHDINPGLLSLSTTWTKDESYCQKEDYDTGDCELNLDLNGTAREFLSVYSGRVFLGDVTFAVDVTRISAPEPASSILLLFGLFVFYCSRTINKTRGNIL